jgi:hypothetical protein
MLPTDKDDGLLRRLDGPWDQAFINCTIDFEKLQPAREIAGSDGTPCPFIDAGGDHDERRARKLVEIPVPDVDQWRQRSTIADISRDRPGAFARPIDKHDLSDRATHDKS